MRRLLERPRPRLRALTTPARLSKISSKSSRDFAPPSPFSLNLPSTSFHWYPRAVRSPCHEALSPHFSRSRPRTSRSPQRICFICHFGSVTRSRCFRRLLLRSVGRDPSRKPPPQRRRDFPAGFWAPHSRGH